MRNGKMCLYGTALFAGIVLGGIMQRQTAEEAGRKGEVSVQQTEQNNAVLAQGTEVSAVTDKEIVPENSQGKYIVPYGWYRTIKLEDFVENPKQEYRFTSSDADVAKVDKKGKITGVGVGSTYISIRPRGYSGEKVTFKVDVERESAGWHVKSNTKKYYVKKNGKRALGYTSIEGDAYFFNKKTSYCLMKKWEYVKLNGKKYKLYFGKKGIRSLDVTGILPKNTCYQLDVNLTKNIVTVYARDGKNGFIIPARAMICSGGMKGHETITGYYNTLKKAGRWHVLRYQSHGQYATRIRGPYLFHSVTYDRYGDHYSLQPKEYKRLGKSASHGCVRLQVRDAKWIYDNSSRCSARLYKDGKEKLPIPKPKAEKIGKTGGGRYYDRTDSVGKGSQGMLFQ